MNSAADIRKINRVIRKEMDRVTAREELSARRITVEAPKTVAARSGQRVYGVFVRYEERLGPTRRWVHRTRGAEL
jgi:hypothetical protein